MQADADALSNRLRIGPFDGEEQKGRGALQRVLSALKTESGETEAPQGEAGAAFTDSTAAFLSGVFAGSSFLFGLAERRPHLLITTLNQSPEAQFADILSRTARDATAASSLREIMKALRLGKSEIALLVALADLGSVWDVQEVTAKLSEAAGVFVSLAVRFLFTPAAQAQQFLTRDPASPDRESGLIVLGMGKFGAHELNYSSDIDLIIFFD